MKPLFYIICIVLFFTRCANVEPDKKNNFKQISFSSKVDSLLKDTTSYNVTVDSLKKRLLSSEDTTQLKLLNDLAEIWRPNAKILADEALLQSYKANNIFNEAHALCKLGIYYYRNSKKDSAKSKLKIAYKIAQSKKFQKIEAEVLSWQSAIQKQEGLIAEAESLLDKSLQIAYKISDKKRIAFCLVSKGEIHRSQSDLDEAVKNYNGSLIYALEINDLDIITICYNGLGEVYRTQSDYPKALEYYNKALTISKKNKNKNRIAFCLKSIGDIYLSQTNYTKSVDNYKEAISIAKEIGNKKSVISCLLGIGQIYAIKNRYTEALNCFEESLKMATEIGSEEDISTLTSNIGDVYNSKKEYNLAIKYFYDSYKKALELGDKNQISICLYSIGECYFNLHKINEAKNISEKSFPVAQESKIPSNVINSALILFKIYEKEGAYKKALDMHKLYTLMKDSLDNEEQVKKFAAVEYKEKENTLKAEQEKKDVINKTERIKNEVELKRQKTLIYAFIVGFLLLLVLGAFVFRSYQQKKKANQIITLQKAEVEHQKEIVEEKQKEIVDSINYAKRIQKALLASDGLLNNYLPEHFVFFQPKDIVSGDFYWGAQLENNQFALVTADSTGHGVPGAIMSMLNISCLNEAINGKKLTAPGEILNYTRSKIIEYLANDGSADGGKDGMDCSLVSFDLKNNQLTYAAANNPVWIVRKNQSHIELIELKGDKMPVGKHDLDTISFTQKTIPLQKGDMVYTITDGMPDQFGGPKGRKFMYKQLKEILVSIFNLPVIEQKSTLSNTLNAWKGDLDQVDDILIIGVRV